MSAITTHILDVSTGFPARGVSVRLEKQIAENWEIVGASATDDDGRIRDLLDATARLETGNYRLIFDTGNYFAQKKTEAFYPQVVVTFSIKNAAQHYHVPLLLSPFGYSTYRGS